MSKRDEILPLFPLRIRELLSEAEIDYSLLREIRLRVNQPVILRSGLNGEKNQVDPGKPTAQSGSSGEIPHNSLRKVISQKDPGGRMIRNGSCEETVLYRSRNSSAAQGTCIVTPQDVRDTVELVSRHSLYAFEEDVKRGFLTVPGGHRVGIAGRVVMDGERVAAVRNISFLNIRISHEVPGCAEAFLPYIIRVGSEGEMPYDIIRARTEGEMSYDIIRAGAEGDMPYDIYHTLILSGPGGGKTTLLRDLVRLLSCEGKNVSVIDERSEIAGCYQGVPENDLGPRTDVLDGCPKAVGCRMALRSLAPDVLAVDELGGREDLEALREVTACGCRIIATMHANGIGDLRAKPFFREVWEQKTFERFLLRDPAVPVGHRGAWQVADENGARIF